MALLFRWNRAPCTWTAAIQTECAMALCQASGYGYQGLFVAASNNPCTASFVAGVAYFYVWTVDQVQYASYTNDAQISANCYLSGTAAPTVQPTPPPTPVGMIRVVSAGTVTRPHCSWNRSPCVWNSSVETECAQALCEASGYGFQGIFVSASNNPCTQSFVSGTAYFYLWTTDTVAYAAYTNDAQITALCYPTARITVISDGSARRPHCTYVWGYSELTSTHIYEIFCFLYFEIQNRFKYCLPRADDIEYSRLLENAHC